MKYNPQSTKIAVIGGGNIGTHMACVCASKGYKVNVYSSKPELYEGMLEAVDEYGNVTVGKINKATSDIGEAVSGCDIVVVTYPANLLAMIADRLLPYVCEGMVILVLPGTGGAEFAFSDCMKAGAKLCGLQRVPSISRLEQYGKRVRSEGLKKELFIGAIPVDAGKNMAGFLEELFEVPCHVLPNYLSVTLTPSNPILHTTRLRTLFADYVPGKVYDRNSLFYAEWTDESSRLLIACDAELQKIIKALPELDLSAVKSLRTYYESDTPEAMTRKLSGIPSFAGIHSPMKQVEGGWSVDLDSRYFTADFPYGLAIIQELAKVLNVDVPNIDETMDWYHSISSDDGEKRFSLADFGIKNEEDIYSIYK